MGDDPLAETTSGPTATWLLIAQAGEKVIADKGFMRATVEEIAAAAGVTVEVFYAHFPGKGALLRAMNQRFVEKTWRTIDDATPSGVWTNARAADLLELAVRSILDVVFQHEGLLRAFLAHGATDRALAEGLKKIGTHLAERLSRALDETVDGRDIEPRRLALALVLAVGVAHHYVLVGDSWSGEAFSRDELAHETVYAIASYLGLAVNTTDEYLAVTSDGR